MALKEKNMTVDDIGEIAQRVFREATAKEIEDHKRRIEKLEEGVKYIRNTFAIK